MQAILPISVLAVLGLAGLAAGCASTTKPGATGVVRPQLLIVPANAVERLATISYERYALKALEAGRLVTQGGEYERVRRIVAQLQAQAAAFRADAARWEWQLALIDAPLVNASCAPGGKITVYTGLLRQLRLTDDEIALVMGHEIAHALREHGRERISHLYLREAFSAALLNPSPGSEPPGARERQAEMEADAIGLELAARAGYDPHAAASLWEKMGKRQSWYADEDESSHPSDTARMERLNALVPKVEPEYEAAQEQR